VTVTATEKQTQYYYNDRLPLAVYRELAAHLESIKGVKTSLIAQDSLQFDYLQSQLKGIYLEYPHDLDLGDQEQIQEILAYYGLN
jgi:hypothetical protein